MTPQELRAAAKEWWPGDNIIEREAANAIDSLLVAVIEHNARFAEIAARECETVSRMIADPKRRWEQESVAA